MNIYNTNYVFKLNLNVIDGVLSENRMYMYIQAMNAQGKVWGKATTQHMTQLVDHTVMHDPTLLNFHDSHGFIFADHDSDSIELISAKAPNESRFMIQDIIQYTKVSKYS